MGDSGRARGPAPCGQFVHHAHVRRRKHPQRWHLKKKDHQDFLKRLRKNIEPRKLSYLHCGEYGGRYRRPHYHTLLFGFAFEDQQFLKKSADGSRLYTSELLQRLWPQGHSTVGALTFESAAYVARYTTDKLNYEKEFAYEHIDVETGEVIPVQQEYLTASLKCGGPGQPGGIAGRWYQRFKGDAYPSDFVVLRGKQMKPPKYYDRLLALEDPVVRAEMKARREREALLRQGDSTTRRLRDRETVKLAQIQNLKRGLE